MWKIIIVSSYSSLRQLSAHRLLVYQQIQVSDWDLASLLLLSSSFSPPHHHSPITSFQVANALPGTQACMFDIKAFHCTCPVLLDHKPFLFVHFDAMFHLDHCHPFGTSLAGSNTGQTCNTLVDIWKAEIGKDGDIKKYEDNLPIIQYPGLLRPSTRSTLCSIR
jgi:hypothetical protein